MALVLDEHTIIWIQDSSVKISKKFTLELGLKITFLVHLHRSPSLTDQID